MLNIIVNNVKLELPVNIEIPFEFINPFFDGFEGKNSHTYNFNVSAKSKVNQKALEFSNDIKKRSLPSKKYESKIWYDGGPKIIGIVRVVKANNLTFQLQFSVNESSFKSLVSNKYLQDLELGGERTIDISASFWSKKYPEVDWALFPVYNYEFANDSPNETLYKDNIKYQNYPSELWAHLIGNNLVVERITPFPYLIYVLESIFDQFGYLIEFNAMKLDADLTALTIFNVTDIYNAKKIVGEDPELIFNKTYLSNHLPKLKIVDFLTAISKKLNIGIFINDTLKKVLILNGDDIITDHSYIDVTENCSPEYESDVEDKFDSFSLNSNPDNNDGFFELLTAPIEDYFDKIKKSVNNLSDLSNIDSELGDVRLVISKKSYYIYTAVDNEGVIEFSWELLAHADFIDYFSQKAWENNLEIKSDASTVAYQSVTDHRNLSRDWLVPATGQKGNFRGRIDGYHEFSLRLLFYRGLQKDSQNNDYPLGSHDVYDFAGNKISEANLSLGYDGEFGLYNRRWKHTINWKLNIARTFERQINFPINMLFNMPWHKKYRIQNTNYLIKKIKGKMRLNKILLDKSEIVKV